MRKLLLVIGLLLLLLLAGCGREKSFERTGIPVPPLPYYGPTTLEERIVTSEIIARVRLRSVSTVGAPEGDHYEPSLELTFDVLEYLKGTGDARIETIANGFNGDVDDEYDSASVAAERASWLLDFRDKRFDDREGVIFLREHEEGFLWLANIGKGGFSQDYKDLRISVANTYNRTWLPDAASGGAQGSSGSSSEKSEQYFLLEDPDAATPTASGVSGPRSISKTSLKAKVAQLEGEIAAYTSDPELYRHCVRAKYEEQRKIRYLIERGEWYEVAQHSLDSGLGSGTRVVGLAWHGVLRVDSGRGWFEGRDADLFEVRMGIMYTARPLPAGEYRVYYNWQWRVFMACNAYPEEKRTRFEEVVTVTSPAGTLAESFFDPYADLSAGQVTGTTTVGTISWQAGQVTATLTQDVTGHALDFIDLNGTTTLSLAAADATSTPDTLSWSVPTQPWSAGDKLMLRIRRSEAPEFSAASYAFTVSENASTGHAVGAVSATDPDGAPVPYSITAGNERGDFVIDSDTGEITVVGALDYETASSYTLTVEARGSGGAATAAVGIAVTPNNPPVADAGPDQTVALGASVTLDASASRDPDVGDTLTYVWEQPAGLAVTLSSTTTASLTFTAPSRAATLTFRVTVSDGRGSDTGDVTVRVRASARLSGTIRRPGGNVYAQPLSDYYPGFMFADGMARPGRFNYQPHGMRFRIRSQSAARGLFQEFERGDLTLTLTYEDGTTESVDLSSLERFTQLEQLNFRVTTESAIVGKVGERVQIEFRLNSDSYTPPPTSGAQGAGRESSPIEAATSTSSN